MKKMNMKRLTLVSGVIIATTLVAMKIVNRINSFNDREVVFISYVRKYPKRTRSYASYPISKHYLWADFANIKKLTFSQPRKGLYRIKLETYAPIPDDTKDILCFSIFFTRPSAERASDTGVMYANKNYPYRLASPPPSPNGGVFRTWGKKHWISGSGPFYLPSWIGGIKASVHGSTVVIDFASELVDNSKQLDLVFVYYLPASIKLPKNASVWSCVGCDVLRIDPSLEKAQIYIPSQP